MLSARAMHRTIIIKENVGIYMDKSVCAVYVHATLYMYHLHS